MRGQARVVLLGLAWSAASAGAARPEEPSLKTVLNRAAAYTADYHQRFTVLVAEEHYVQRVGPERTVSEPEKPGVEAERTLKSDYIMLRDFAGTNSWLGVREVLEVDGQPVTVDRDRLRALLEDTSKPLTLRVRALGDLQAQYNLGNLYRTINVPTLPLEILLADRQPRFRFKHTGTNAIIPRSFARPRGTISSRAATSGSIRPPVLFFERSCAPGSSRADPLVPLFLLATPTTPASTCCCPTI
jgi:hypothetical protein